MLAPPMGTPQRANDVVASPCVPQAKALRVQSGGAKRLDVGAKVPHGRRVQRRFFPLERAAVERLVVAIPAAKFKGDGVTVQRGRLQCTE